MLLRRSTEREAESGAHPSFDLFIFRYIKIFPWKRSISGKFIRCNLRALVRDGADDIFRLFLVTQIETVKRKISAKLNFSTIRLSSDGISRPLPSMLNHISPSISRFAAINYFIRRTESGNAERSVRSLLYPNGSGLLCTHQAMVVLVIFTAVAVSGEWMIQQRQPTF